MEYSAGFLALLAVGSVCGVYLVARNRRRRRDARVDLPPFLHDGLQIRDDVPRGFDVRTTAVCLGHKARAGRADRHVSRTV